MPCSFLHPFYFGLVLNYYEQISYNRAYIKQHLELRSYTIMCVTLFCTTSNHIEQYLYSHFEVWFFLLFLDSGIFHKFVLFPLQYDLHTNVECTFFFSLHASIIVIFKLFYKMRLGMDSLGSAWTLLHLGFK